MKGERRGFFREALASLKKLVDEDEAPLTPTFVPGAPAGDDEAAEPSAPPATRRPRRPPGALPEEAFLAACTRCGACIEACPESTLVADEAGLPVADIERHPCMMCRDVPCAAACEPGPGGVRALVVGPIAEIARFGTARPLLRLCLNAGWAEAPEEAREAPCERCVDWCPVPGALALDQRALPVVDGALCTGCGLCAAHCKAYPRALTIDPA